MMRYPHLVPEGLPPDAGNFAAPPPDPPAAAAAAPAAKAARTRTLENLRQRIRALERGARPAPADSVGAAAAAPGAVAAAGAAGPPDAAGPPAAATRRAMLAEWAPEAGQPWTFGDAALDGLLPGRRLDATALHEIKPCGYGDWPAAIALALRLAVRRLGPEGEAQAGPGAGRPRILWCQTAARAGDLGRLYVPGLAALGLASDALLEVEAVRAADVLWAMEEGLASRALALVVGGVDAVDLDLSRRLGLAAAGGATPCLLLTAPRAAGAPAATTRWRIARAPSGEHPFDPAAPGPARLTLALERCRGGAPFLDDRSLTVEWCDGTRRFRVVAGLADRAAGEVGARRGA